MTMEQLNPGDVDLVNTYYNSAGEVLPDITVKLNLEEPSIDGGITFHKIDNESGNSTHQGTATLQGAEITIYAAEDINYIDTVTNTTKKWLANESTGIVVTTDENGIARTADRALPYGKYYAIETKTSNAGYLINSDWRVDFQIREDNVMIDTVLETMHVPSSDADDAKSGWTQVVG